MGKEVIQERQALQHSVHGNALNTIDALLFECSKTKDPTLIQATAKLIEAAEVLKHNKF